MKEVCFSVKEMAFLIGVTRSCINQRIRYLELKPEYKENQMRFFSKNSYQKIVENKRIDTSDIIVYEPFRIETIYHIIPSKMNYLKDHEL